MPNGTGASGGAGATIRQFLELLETTAILAADELQTLRSRYPAANLDGDAASLARELVDRGKLTRYQAAGAYQLKPKSLAVGPFVFLDRLGSGGMGTVYKARHRLTGEVRAVKILNSSALRSADSVKRFQREAATAIRLNHPNIVRALETGEIEGQHYLVMELVDGVDLSNYLRKQGALPLDQAAHCVLQAARALSYAHGEGLVHRDIKPGNLLLARDGNVKILDMGLARFDDPTSLAAGHAEEGLTQTGQVMGTVDFMAPEQALNTRLADARADIYSLGCTFFRLVTGRNPFGGESLVEKILAHREHPIPSLRAVNPQIPVATDMVLARMLAKRPEDRYQAMSEVIEDLEHSLSTGTVPVRLRPVAVAIPAYIEGPSSYSLNLPSSGATPSCERYIAPRKSSTLVWGSAAVAGMLVAAAAFLLLRSEEESPTADSPPAAPMTVQTNGMGTGLAAAATGTPPAARRPVGETVALKPPPEKSAIDKPAVSATAARSVPTISIASITAAPTATSTAARPSATSPVPVPGVAPVPDAAATVRDARSLAEWCRTRQFDVIVWDSAAKVMRTIGPDDDLPQGQLVLVGVKCIRSKELRDVDLPHLFAGPDLTTLDLSATHVTDAGVGQLNRVRQLQGLLLDETSIGDAGLTALLPIDRLRQLDVSHTKITETGIEAVGSFSNLYYLGLAGLSVTDRVVLKLASLRGLRDLDLSHTKVTDAAVTTLATFDNLRSLLIRGTAITDEGRRRLAAALPNCRIDERSVRGMVVWHPEAARGLTSGTTTNLTAAANPPAGGSNVAGPPTAATSATVSTSTNSISPAAAPAIVSAPKRLAVPEGTAIEAGLQLVRTDLYREEYQKAKRPEERAALAKMLSERADKMSDDPVGQFVMWREVRDLAAEAGETDLVEQAVSSAARAYEIDELTWIADAYEGALKRPTAGAINKRIAARLLEKLEQALADDRYDVGERFMDSALAAARKAQDPAVLKSVVEQSRQFDRDKQQWELVKKARETLKTKPDDGPANLLAGRYACFVRGDWRTGLPMLAKGSDPNFQELAEKSLTAPTEPDDVMALADLWWAKSERTGVAQLRKEFQIGALYWYEQVAPKVKGLLKTKIDKRMAEAAEAAASMPSRRGTTPPTASITVSASPTPTAFAAPTPQAYKALIDWVLQRNGRVILRVPNGSGTSMRYVDEPAEIPNGVFEIRGVSFYASNPPLTDVDFQYLAGYPWLAEFDIHNTLVTDAGLAAMAAVPAVEQINVSPSGRLTDAGMAPLAKCARLQSLSLINCGLTGAGVKYLVGLRTLTQLNLSRNPIDDAEANAFAQLPQLTSLELSGTRVGDATLASLAGMNRLSYLNLSATRVSDAGLSRLRGLTELASLTLDDCAITGPGLTALESCSQLANLSLDRTRVTDAGLNGLVRLQRLSSLYLANTQLTDAAAGVLGSLRLRYLRLRGTQLSPAAVQSIQIRMPQCRIYTN